VERIISVLFYSPIDPKKRLLGRKPLFFIPNKNEYSYLPIEEGMPDSS
jgi:hypothetical protein